MYCRYFSLVVALIAHTANGNCYTIVAHVSERIIVRVRWSFASSYCSVHILIIFPCRHLIQEHLIMIVTWCGIELLVLTAFTIWYSSSFVWCVQLMSEVVYDDTSNPFVTVSVYFRWKRDQNHTIVLIAC